MPSDAMVQLNVVVHVWDLSVLEANLGGLP